MSEITSYQDSQKCHQWAASEKMGVMLGYDNVMSRSEYEVYIYGLTTSSAEH